VSCIYRALKFNMSKFLFFDLRRATLNLLLIWFVISAFYYTQHLFTPRFYMGYDEGTLHKTLKYFACLLLSVYFCFAARAWGLLFFSGSLVLLAAFFAINGGGLQVATVSFMVVGTMIPFILTPKLWGGNLLLIGRVIVVCGALVGVFSVIEMTLLTSLFESAWASHGSIRSISTLFNPNNLGLYAGAALLLLPYMQLKTIWTSLCSALLLFSLVASGSRTAWVSLVIVLIYALMASPNARARLLKWVFHRLPQLLIPGLMLVSIYVVYIIYRVPTDIELTTRGVDLYSASIRWENFLTFLSLIDGSVFFPDITGVRDDYITDSFYLVVLNSFGVIGVLVFFLFWITHFSLIRNKNPDLFPWRLVFIFYMVSGMSGSQLNSFPNNQMFFLSMGAVWIYRLGFGASNTAQTGFAHSVNKNNYSSKSQKT
jgi:hypothetical protein